MLPRSPRPSANIRDEPPFRYEPPFHYEYIHRRLDDIPDFLKVFHKPTPDLPPKKAFGSTHKDEE